MKLECKPGPSHDMHPAYDWKDLKMAVLSIAAGGQKSMTIKTQDAAQCLKVCKSEIFDDTCYSGGGCNASVSGCTSHSGCACMVNFMCNEEGWQVIPSKPMTGQWGDTLQVLLPYLDGISTGGRRKLQFSTKGSRVCLALCDNKLLKGLERLCLYGSAKCEVQCDYHFRLHFGFAN